LDQAILAEKPTVPIESPAQSLPSALPLAQDAELVDLLREQSAFPSTVSPPADGIPLMQANAASSFSDLDALLAKNVPLTAGAGPIVLPGDVLFDYDTYQLQSNAVESLEKLGRLLRRDPSLRFRIEGHSDSFGPDDYNLRLSELRAATVKNWLVSAAGLPADSIEIVGFGETRPVAPVDGSIEAQLPNRRVEILVLDPVP
jgi:outer membrane protein OmpA-like peptidoglycan-associated protein